MCCKKCRGKVLLDRSNTDRATYELYCLVCGKRDFVSKLSDIGRYITQHEFQLSLQFIGEL